VALVETSPDDGELIPVQLRGRELHVGPGLMKQGHVVAATVLTDGPRKTTAVSPLQNVRLDEANPQQATRDGARRLPAGLAGILTVAVALVTLIVASVPVWAQFRGVTEELGRFVAGVNQFSGGCDSFSLIVQNQWQPYGSVVRVAPNTLARGVSNLAGNQTVKVDGWVHGQAAYPTNPMPWNSDAWFHLADGTGWVPYAGLRTAPTAEESGQPRADGTAAPPLSPKCLGVAN
jgi:hypothetical protein